jgi:hypothetical protein
VLFRILTWIVRAIAHKAEELDSVLNKKQIKIAAITESKKELKITMEINNYIVIYGGVNRNTGAQVGVVIWAHNSVKNTIINNIYCSKIVI